MTGLLTSTLTIISIIKDRPEPFGPPSGVSVATFFGSVVGCPCSSTPQSDGMDIPASLAAMTLPSATLAVDMSSTIGSPREGTAMASGLVETAEPREP